MANHPDATAEMEGMVRGEECSFNNLVLNLNAPVNKDPRVDPLNPPGRLGEPCMSDSSEEE
jgi:hypothetical protein